MVEHPGGKHGGQTAGQIDSGWWSLPAGPLALLTVTFYLSFLARIILAPLLPEIERDLGLGHDGSGVLFLMISLGHALMLLGSGFVSRALNHRRTIVVSALAAGGSLLLAAASGSQGGLRLGLLGVGMATGLYLPSGIATITDIVHKSRWGRALAVHEQATSMAFFTAPLIAEAFLDSLGWRWALGLLGLASIVAGVVFLNSKGESFRGEAPTISVVRALISQPALWFMIALMGLGIGGNFGVYSMLPLYLVADRGIAREFANTMVSLARPVGLLSILISGWLADRFGAWQTMRVSLTGAGVMTIVLALVPNTWILPVLFLQTMWAVAFFPPAFSAFLGMTSPRIRNVFLALAMSSAILFGNGLVPTVIGMFGEAGRFSLGIIGIGGINLLVGLILILTNIRPAAFRIPGVDTETSTRLSPSEGF